MNILQWEWWDLISSSAFLESNGFIHGIYLPFECSALFIPEFSTQTLDNRITTLFRVFFFIIFWLNYYTILTFSYGFSCVYDTIFVQIWTVFFFSFKMLLNMKMKCDFTVTCLKYNVIVLMLIKCVCDSFKIQIKTFSLSCDSVCLCVCFRRRDYLICIQNSFCIQ